MSRRILIKKTLLLSLAGIVAIGLMAGAAWAKDVRGVTDTEVKIACLVDLSGPGKYGGPPIADAFRDYVAWINANGGINGRKINLVVEDNGILPNTTMNAAKKVILKDGVFAIGFNLGSAGSSAILPLCQQNQVALFPHGANREFYRPGNKWVFVPHTVQYSMACRAVEYILSQNPGARIGIIYQDDAFGQEGLEGAEAAAKYMKSGLVKKMAYKTGTLDFSPHMNAMKEAKADWIVLWTYLPQSAAIIKQKVMMGWKEVKLISNNTTGVPPLFALTGENADGYMLVTPYAPGWMNLPGIKRVKDINKKYGNPAKTLGNPMYPDYLYLAGWGYIEAVGQGLKNAGRELTPETFVQGLEKVNFDMGGLSPNISFTPDRHVSSFESLILRADGKKKRFVIIDQIKSPKTPQ